MVRVLDLLTTAFMGEIVKRAISAGSDWARSRPDPSAHIVQGKVQRLVSENLTLPRRYPVTACLLQRANRRVIGMLSPQSPTAIARNARSAASRILGRGRRDRMERLLHASDPRVADADDLISKARYSVSLGEWVALFLESGDGVLVHNG